MKRRICAFLMAFILCLNILPEYVKADDFSILQIQVDDVERYIFEKDHQNSYYVEELETDIPYDWDRIDCYPHDGISVITNEGEISGHFEELERTLSEKLGETHVWWESDEKPKNLWEAGNHKAKIVIEYGETRLEQEYNVNVLESPFVKLEVDDLTRIITERDYQDRYWDENGEEHQQDWDRVDCWPEGSETRLYCSDEDVFTVYNPDELRDKIRDKYGIDVDIWWESEENPENKWALDDGKEHNAKLHVADQEASYRLELIENPIKDVQFGTVERYVNERYDRRDWVCVDEEEDRWKDVDWRALDCFPREGEITVTDADYDVYEDMNGGDIQRALEEKYGCRFRFDVTNNDESYNNLWKAGEHKATLNISGKAYEFDVTVLESPLKEISVGKLVRLVNDFDHQDHYWDEEKQEDVFEEWDRIDCWPEGAHIVLTLTDDDIIETEDPNELRDKIRDRFGFEPDIWWENNESYGHTWSIDDTEPHMAKLHVGELEAEYEVELINNPIKSVTVGTITRFEFERNDRHEHLWDEESQDWYDVDFQGVDLFPREGELTVILDNDEELTGNDWDIRAELTEKYGCRFISDIISTETADNLWTAGKYEATYVLGGISTDFTAVVEANPVTSIEVNTLRRIVSERDYQDRYWDEDGEEHWLDWDRVDCWPAGTEITVKLSNGDTIKSDNPEEIRDTLREIFDHDFDIWWDSDEKPDNPWAVDDEKTHKARFGIEDTEAEYEVELINNPIKEVQIPEITRFVFDRFDDEYRYWDEERNEDVSEWWRKLDCTPNGDEREHITVITDDGEEFKGEIWHVRDLLSEKYGCSFWFDVRTDETPYKLWEVDEHEAILFISGAEFSYKVNVIDTQVESFTVEGIQIFDIDTFDEWGGYEDENGEWIDPEDSWKRHDPWPREAIITLKTKDGEEIVGDIDQIWDRLREKYNMDYDIWWESDETPDNFWTAGNHKALLYIGNVSSEYDVEVVHNGVVSVVVPDITRLETDRFNFHDWDENGDFDWLKLDCWPRDEEIIVKMEDDKEFRGRADDLDGWFRENYEEPYRTGWESDENVDEPWTAGPHTAWIDINGFTSEYTVNVAANPVTEVRVDDISRLISDKCHADGYEDEEGNWVEESWMKVDCWPDNICVVADGVEYSGDVESVRRQLKDAYGFDFNDMHWESDESKIALWKAGEHSAVFIVEGVSSGPYKVTVANDPIKSIEITDIVRLNSHRVHMDHYFDGENDVPCDYERIDCWPNGAEYTIVLDLPEGEKTITGDEESIRNQIYEETGVNIRINWYSDESPDNPWNVGEHFATLSIGSADYVYKVTVIDNPIVDVKFGDIVRPSYDRYPQDHYYDSETDDWIQCDPFDAINLDLNKGEFKLILENGEEIECNIFEIYDIIKDKYGVDIGYHVESTESPDYIWTAGNEYQAALFIDGAPYEFTVKVIDSPIISVTAEDCTRCIDNGREMYRAMVNGEIIPVDPWWLVYSEPGVITVTTADKTYTGNPEDVIQEMYADYGAYFWYNVEDDQNYDSEWEPGVHRCRIVFGDKSAEYDITVFKFMLGDVNGDGDITAADLTILARHVAKIEEIKDPDLLRAGNVTRITDGDKDITAADLTALARHVAKIEMLPDADECLALLRLVDAAEPYAIDFHLVSDADLFADAVELYKENRPLYEEMLTKTNEIRVEAGVTELVLDDKLCVAATMRAIEMSRAGTISHTRPDGSSWATVLVQIGYLPVNYYDSNANWLSTYAYEWGENILGGNSIDEVLYKWKNSSRGHYKLMIDSECNAIGVGFCNSCYVHEYACLNLS